MSNMSGATPQRVTLTFAVDLDPAAFGFDLSDAEAEEIVLREVNRAMGVEASVTTPPPDRKYELGMGMAYAFCAYDRGDRRLSGDGDTREFAEHFAENGGSPFALRRLYEEFADRKAAEVDAAQQAHEVRV